MFQSLEFHRFNSHLQLFHPNTCSIWENPIALCLTPIPFPKHPFYWKKNPKLMVITHILLLFNTCSNRFTVSTLTSSSFTLTPVPSEKTPLLCVEHPFLSQNTYSFPWTDVPIVWIIWFNCNTNILQYEKKYIKMKEIDRYITFIKKKNGNEFLKNEKKEMKGMKGMKGIFLSFLWFLFIPQFIGTAFFLSMRRL